MNKLCSLRVRVMKPRRTIRSSTIKSALKNFLVPCIASSYRVFSLRALWEVNAEDNHIAELNIWSKRKQIEVILNHFEDVVAYFSCLTALESAEVRRKLRARKRRIDADHNVSGSDTDNEYDTYEDDGTLIPGKENFNFSSRFT